jgi:hypothetical protein
MGDIFAMLFLCVDNYRLSMSISVHTRVYTKVPSSHKERWTQEARTYHLGGRRTLYGCEEKIHLRLIHTRAYTKVPSSHKERGTQEARDYRHKINEWLRR